MRSLLSPFVRALNAPLPASRVLHTDRTAAWLQAAQQHGRSMASTAAPARQFTAEELRQYDGRDGGPVYIALRGRVLDVSEGRSFYGPGGPYAIFGGRECARALAIMKVTPEECTANLEDATEKQLKTLSDWEAKLGAKYPVVGALVGGG